MTSPCSTRRSSLWIASTASMLVAFAGGARPASALTVPGAGDRLARVRAWDAAFALQTTTEQHSRGGGGGRGTAGPRGGGGGGPVGGGPGAGGPGGGGPIDRGGFGPQRGTPREAAPPPTSAPDGGRARDRQQPAPRGDGRYDGRPPARGGAPAPPPPRTLGRPYYGNAYGYGGYGYGGYGYGYDLWLWGGIGVPGWYYGGPFTGWYYDPSPVRYIARRREGTVRLKVTPKQAQVYVDGYYAGNVDDFDGVFQSLELERGEHTIEVRMRGYAPLRFDVRVRPGRTVTFRGVLEPGPDRGDDRDDDRPRPRAPRPLDDRDRDRDQDDN